MGTEQDYLIKEKKRPLRRWALLLTHVYPFFDTCAFECVGPRVKPPSRTCMTLSETIFPKRCKLQCSDSS